MREAHSSKDDKEGDKTSAKAAPSESPGVAAASDVTSPAAEKQAAASSEENAGQLDNMDSEGSPAA